MTYTFTPRQLANLGNNVQMYKEYLRKQEEKEVTNLHEFWRLNNIERNLISTL